MSEIEAVITAVESVRRRIRWHRAWSGLWFGLLCCSLIWAAGTFAFKLLPVPFTWFFWGGMAGLLFMPVCFLREWARPISREETARWIDQRQGLEERLSTALELHKNKEGGAWWTLLLQDAARHATGLEPKQLLPLRIPRRYRWIMVLLAVAAGLGFAPEYRSKAALEALREIEVVRDVGKHLEVVAHPYSSRRAQSMEKSSKAVANADELARQMTAGVVTRTEALKELTSVTGQLKQEMKNLANAPDLKPLKQAARSPQTGGAPPTASETQPGAARKEMEKNSGSGDAIQQMKDELAKAKQTGAGLAGQNSDSASKARQELGQQLANLASKLAEMGQELPELNDAMEALKNSQNDLFLKDMDLATLDLDKMKQMAENLASRQSAAERAGKDLAEQLELGQAEQAQKRLQEMIAALKDSKLSPEQLQKILNETQNSLAPASPYGKVAQHLADAAKAMKMQSKQDAAADLAQAASELEKLSQQAQGMDKMAATLASFEKAQQCLSSSQTWANCKRPGSAGKKGKPGRGVGTWADENNWFFNPEIQQYADNTNVKRPDTASKGNTDRGDGELPPNLAPTKLHGKFSPGGPMPSITLKGVSIKGRSTVAYQEAATAAQSAAESALNQDQVPQAYQGAVKDYFNDLKQ